MAQGTCHTRVGEAVSADVVSCVFDLLKCLLADGQSTVHDRGVLLTVVSFRLEYKKSCGMPRYTVAHFNYTKSS